MAAEMDARSILTRRGGRWQVSNVRNFLLRLDAFVALEGPAQS
jgi:hypothetical protein